MANQNNPVHELAGIQALEQLTGEVLGTSDWVSIPQDRINQFADATGDHQWIHVDSARAAQSTFGATIAHGYLTLGLVPALFGRIIRVAGVSSTINYGINRARFPAPVPVNSRVRGLLSLVKLDRGVSGATATFSMVIELDGSYKPACIVEFVFVFLT